MKKFEYTVLDVPSRGFFGGSIDYAELTNKLNELGKHGWEAVTSSVTTMYSHASRGLIIILKREIQ